MKEIYVIFILAFLAHGVYVYTAIFVTAIVTYIVMIVGAAHDVKICMCGINIFFGIEYNINQFSSFLLYCLADVKKNTRCSTTIIRFNSCFPAFVGRLDDSDGMWFFLRESIGLPWAGAAGTQSTHNRFLFVRTAYIIVIGRKTNRSTP